MEQTEGLRFSEIRKSLSVHAYILIWWLIPRLIGYGFRSIMSRNVRLYSYSFVQKNTYGANRSLQFSKIRKSMDVHFLDGGAWRASFLEFKLFPSSYTLRKFLNDCHKLGL